MEKYLDVVGFEGLYMVSNLGSVRSLHNRNTKDLILKYGVSGSGYAIVTLCKGENRYTRTIHRLVAEAFLGESKLVVNHKDGNKLNNRLDNLEYVTRSQNILHALDNGLFTPNYQRIAIEKRKMVAQIDPKTNKVLNIYNSAHEAARVTGFNRGNICSVCRGIANSANGFQWKYQINS